MVVLFIIIFVCVLIFSLCKQAGESDDIAKKYWDEYWGKDTKEEEDGLL